MVRQLIPRKMDRERGLIKWLARSHDLIPFNFFLWNQILKSFIKAWSGIFDCLVVILNSSSFFFFLTSSFVSSFSECMIFLSSSLVTFNLFPFFLYIILFSNSIYSYFVLHSCMYRFLDEHVSSCSILCFMCGSVII